MQSNNPVFRNSDEFNGKASNAYGNQVYGGSGTPTQGYGQSDPSTWSTGNPHAHRRRPRPDDHRHRRAEDRPDPGRRGRRRGRHLGADRRHHRPDQSPAPASTPRWRRRPRRLRAVDGQLVQAGDQPRARARLRRARGRRSSAPSARCSRHQFGGGLVIGAVVGTMAAVAGTLAAYRFFHIQVGQKFRTWVIAAMFGFVAVSLLDFVLSFFGASFGFNGFGGLGFVISLVGLGPRRADADPRLRLRRARHRRAGCRSASRGARPSA